jgi:hypothetical protein
MNSKKGLVGMRVRVYECYRNPQPQGLEGIIKQKRVLADNSAFVVELEDGRTDMFWDHELEETR